VSGERGYLVAKGNASAESDLDVAIEIEPTDNGDTALGVWIGEAGNWRKELQPEIHVALDLQWYDSLGSTPAVEAGLKDGGVLIHDRASTS
jgi:predicted nucleotidyltransferase